VSPNVTQNNVLNKVEYFYYYQRRIKMENKEKEITLDIREIFGILRKRFWLIFIITLLATLISGGVSFYYLKPVYESSLSIVIGKTIDSTQKSQYDYNDIMMYQNLVKTYAEIAKSRTVAQKAIDKLGLSSTVTPDTIQNQISVIPQVNTQIIDLKVKNENPQKSKDILNAIAESFIEESGRIYPNGNVQTIDEAIIPKSPISPNKRLNILMAFLLGLMISTGLSFMLEYIDNTIKNTSDVDRYMGIPVIGMIFKRPI
jgi:capsular polysaccharide biosynthesis protein